MQFPTEFVDQIKKIIGNEWEDFMQVLSEKSPTSIRINPLKVLQQDKSIYKEKVPWTSNAYYLNERPIFTLDPLFHAGTYYVQEASSMYLEQIIIKNIPDSPVKTLDLCAAPGGKSTHLASILPEKSLLVANEVIRSRANILVENLIKWGNPNNIITNNNPYAFGQQTAYFDLILADVPCSGEGMFRKDPNAIREWSVDNVHLCAERQKRIIADSWPALKPGGILIYSTCTYNREENENNVDWICHELGAETIDGPHRFFPHKINGEGFFIVALRKNAEENNVVNYRYEKKKEKSNRPNKKTKIPEEMKNWIDHPDRFSFLPHESSIIAFPSDYIEDFDRLKKRLNIIYAGIKIGEIKGKDQIPAHELALSSALSKERFPTLQVDKVNALRYLRKDPMSISFSELPKGYILILYRNQPLGFIKNIGNRINNLYPNEWRIKMNID